MGSPGSSRIRVCVCTSYRADSEPRAPRHAAAIAESDRVGEVVFLECVPAGEKPSVIPQFADNPRIRTVTHWYPHRRVQPIRTIVRRGLRSLATWLHALGGTALPGILSTRVIGVEARLRNIGADLYLAHNIDMLLPASRAAGKVGGKLAFDAMEFHSDMGDGQSPHESAIIREIEGRELRKCVITLASSDQVADALAESYGIVRPLPLYNAPPLTRTLAERPDRPGLALYWRNTVIGFGQRGLEDALLALTRLPSDVSLHLRGRPAHDGGIALRGQIERLGLGSRVVVHPPHHPDAAVKAAAEFDVGLCLERPGLRNHELTVSNKLFDYMMGGLAVIASDLPGLRAVVERSGAGLWYEPGNPEDLAEKILKLYEAPALRLRLSRNAREFAISEGNREFQMERFQRELARVLGP